MMTAVLGTLPFLATLWLLVVLGAALLEESGAKIAAALKGEQASVSTVETRRARMRSRVRQARRVSVPLRAAA
jgi:hypothetical protein